MPHNYVFLCMCYVLSWVTVAGLHQRQALCGYIHISPPRSHRNIKGQRNQILFNLLTVVMFSFVSPVAQCPCVVVLQEPCDDVWRLASRGG